MFLVNSFSMTAIQLYHQLLFYYLKYALIVVIKWTYQKAL